MSMLVITLEDILERYYYEMVQDEARYLGLVASRTKPELIDDIMAEYQSRRVDVEETAENLLSRFYADEIKSYARDLGLSSKGRKSEIITRILQSLTIEPILKYAVRDCGVCLMETEQEIHFNKLWKASLAQCRQCSHTEALGVIEPIAESKKSSNNTKQNLEIFGVSVAIFFGLTTIILRSYDLTISVLAGLILSVLSYIILSLYQCGSRDLNPGQELGKLL